ncbi:MAG: serine hydrolase domain-containing protein [Ignavibacteriaceae bacterium]|nr:serine hydrolase domain-containing protein [Ignavibacteriaceae bacterium]
MTTAQCQNNITPEKLDGVMKKLYPEDIPGAALLVVSDNKILISKGYGIANTGSNENIFPDTHFRMASVSKQFTAMCILILQSQKKLNIGDAVIKYLPSLPEFAAGVTIKNLLTHTSGLFDYESLIPKDQKEQISDADVLQFISSSDSLYFTPGSQYKYSNTGFCLLTQIVEKVSGLSYPEFIRENIFIPFDMKHSVIYEKDKEIFKRAYGYHLKDNQWLFADQSITSATMGDGSVYTSLNEYQQWIMSLWKQQFNDDQVNPLKPHANIKKGLSYGYGWFIANEADGSTAYFHSGESTGFHNIVYHNPAKKFMVVLFSNCDDERVSRAFAEIMADFDIQLKDIPQGKTLFEFLSDIYGD